MQGKTPVILATKEKVETLKIDIYDIIDKLSVINQTITKL